MSEKTPRPSKQHDYDSRGRVSFGTSLSREMHAFLKKRAEKNKRALSQEIEAVLQAALRQEVVRAMINGEI